MAEINKVLITAIIFSIIQINPIHAHNDFAGFWSLEIKQSTNPEKAFKGKLRSLALKWKSQENKLLPDGRYRERLADYEKQHLESQKRKSAKNLKRLGLLLPLINCNSLQIKKEKRGNIVKFRLTYDNVLTREFKVSETGRVYSARGDELSESIFGYTLAYLEKNTLILETDTYDGHRVKEYLYISGRELNYDLTFDSFILLEKVTLNKLFFKKSAF